MTTANFWARWPEALATRPPSALLRPCRWLPPLKRLKSSACSASWPLTLSNNTCPRGWSNGRGPPTTAWFASFLRSRPKQRARLLNALYDFLDVMIRPLAVDEMGMTGRPECVARLMRLLEDEHASGFARVKADRSFRSVTRYPRCSRSCSESWRPSNFGDGAIRVNCASPPRKPSF